MITTRPQTARILLLDTSQTERRSLSLAFADGPYVFTETNSLESALTALHEDDIHLFLVNYTENLPKPDEIVRHARFEAPAVEIVVVMPGARPETIAEIIDTGAFDCLPEMPPTQTLMARARKALEHRELKMRLTGVREQVAMNYGFDNLVGISRSMADLKDTLARLAPTDIPILITGDAGTGRDLCAHVLHHHSEHRNFPLLTVDCKTPEPVLSLELFGGENSNRPGLLAQANNGSILLKNVDQMPAETQEKFYAFMKTYTLPGTDTRLSVRILATTTVTADDLRKLDTFRKDLAEKISVIAISLPTLAERTEDIEMLIEYFLRKIAAETGRTRLTISRPAADRLIRYSWPGNVRELENTLRRAAALTSDKELDTDDIVFVSGENTTTGVTGPIETTAKIGNFRLADNQRELIEKALIENDWNYTQTAQELGIGRTTLWRKVKKYNLKPETTSA